MDRRAYDGGSAYFQRSDDPEEYSNQRDAMQQRDWYKRSSTSRDPWERSVDSFLEGDSRKEYRDRSPRSRSPERDRSRPRRRSSSKEKRGSSRDYRGSPRDDRREEGRDDRRSRDGDGEGSRYREGYRDRRDWDDDRYRESREGRWSRYDREKQGKRDEWLEKVWLTSDNSSDVMASFGGDSDYDKYRFMGERYGGEEIVQNRTIIIRGLAQHITENDIRQEIKKCQLQPTDIRMIRRKNGTSRGFAFVEFATTEEAIQCMELKNGELMLNNHYRAIMQFSLPKEPRDKWNSDWHCKCSAHNFKRREFCYKCGCTREKALEGVEEVSTHPTNTVLLRGLDTLTTEASVLECIQTLSALPIRSVRIGRDPVTNTSLGVCYIEMNCVIDATYLHNALLMADPVIDEKKPIISYFKSDSSTSAPASKAGNTAVEAAQWSHQKSTSNQYTLKDVSRLAEYSANLYATTPEEKESYLAYYQQYYHKQISEGEQISLPANISTANLATKDSKTPLAEAPNGSGEHTYPVPDVSTYQYDKTSGYYYDPYTTLYYDANSQYYYNSKMSKFLYWDSVKATYLPAPTATSTNTAPPLPLPETSEEIAAKEEELKKLKEKEKPNDKDKVKVAKRIAKDMEKWAKTLNHKKEIAKQNLIASASSFPMLKAQGAADIGFAVLERKDLPATSGLTIPVQVDSPIVVNQPDSSLVAEYGQGSDSDDEMDEGDIYDKEHTDWSKLACLLCKRQFPNKEVLIKHQQLSDLHKQNLNKWYKANGIDPEEMQKDGLQYRDRAKERRQKYGEPDKPHPNKLKETYIKAKEATVSYEEPTKMGIGADNLGNKLLQKMGWQEGMGLGKKNQGRTTIIQAERRSATAGLGTKSQGVVPGPGETYKDCVRKMMYIRYKEIEENA